MTNFDVVLSFITVSVKIVFEIKMGNHLKTKYNNKVILFNI